jgi:hypothetical protein
MVSSDADVFEHLTSGAIISNCKLGLNLVGITSASFLQKCRYGVFLLFQGYERYALPDFD